jgi:hypothetical protein
MYCYYTGASPDNLRKAREHAPSHCHGAGWTPRKMTGHDVPYFLDNGAYSGAFDPDDWLDALEAAKTEMPRRPEFVVLPDVYGDAEATLERHAEAFDASRRAFDPRHADADVYAVLQPGVPIAKQVEEHVATWAPEGFFVGGSKRWKRAHGDEVVRQARDLGKPVHVGNPSDADGLAWAYRTGFDSADTTSVFQNQNWHWLERLEAATEETASPEPRDVDQTDFAEWGEA